MRQIYMPAIFSFFLSSYLFGSCAFGVGREEVQSRRSNSDPSFLAAGSNNMANSFWSTGKGTIPREKGAYRGETFNFAYLDSNKKSVKQYRGSRSRSNSLYDSRNYVDEDTSQYIDVSKRSRGKDDFKNRKNFQRYNYYSRAMDQGEPEDDSEKEINKEEGDENTVTGKEVGKLYERQYQNYQSSNRRFFDRNIEDSGRSVYARRDIGYDYPFGNGFGEEQIYYYYYDPDVDSLSLGFNSHSPQNMDDHRINNDNLMMYTGDDDNDNSDVRFKKKYTKGFPNDSNENNGDKKESEKQQSQEELFKMNTDLEEKIVPKQGENEMNISTTIITSTNGIEVEELDKSDAAEHRAEEKDDDVSITTSSSFTSGRTAYQKNEMKKEQDKLEESFQNQVDDYQQRKPDIIPYRNAVPNPERNETSTINESEKSADFIPQKDTQFSFTTTTKSKVIQKADPVIKRDSDSVDKVRENSHATNYAEVQNLHNSTIPTTVGGNDMNYAKDTDESNQVGLEERRTDTKASSSAESIKTKDEFNTDNKSQAQIGINTKAPKRITIGAASLKSSMINQTRNAKKSIDINDDIGISPSKARSKNVSKDINNIISNVLVIKDKNTSDHENRANSKFKTKNVEYKSKLDILRNTVSISKDIAGIPEPVKETSPDIRNDIMMLQRNNSTELEKSTQNISLILFNRRDSKDQTSDIGITVDGTINMTSEKNVTSLRDNPYWTLTEETTQSSIEGNNTATKDIISVTVTIKSSVQGNKEHGSNLTHPPPIKDSISKNININNESNAINLLDEEGLSNKTKDLRKIDKMLDDASEVMMVNNSVFPGDVTRDKTDIETFAKMQEEDVNVQQAERPSKRWPVGIPFKKGINSPASISHEDKGVVPERVNATHKSIDTTINYAKPDHQSSKTTAGEPKNGSTGSMNSHKSISASMTNLPQQDNTSNQNLKEMELSNGNNTSSITVVNISSQTDETSTMAEISVHQESEQSQTDIMAQRFSAFLKSDSIKESHKNIENSKKQRTPISSSSHNDSRKPIQTEQKNTQRGNINQNEKTNSHDNTTQVPETSPESFNDVNKSHVVHVQKESEHDVDSSETKSNSMPMIEGKTEQELRKNILDQRLTKSSSMSNETFPISAAASVRQPDIASNDQHVNGTMVQSLSQETDVFTAMMINDTVKNLQTDSGKSDIPIQKELKTKENQDSKKHVSSVAQTTFRPFPSMSSLQIEKILFPNISSTILANDTRMNYTVTPETKLTDKNSSIFATPVTRNLSVTMSGFSLAEETGNIDDSSEVKIDFNKTNETEAGKDDKQENGYLNSTRKADEGDSVSEVTQSHNEQINDEDYVEPEIPEVSAYMIQDFSLKISDPAREATKSHQNTSVQTLSQNKTAADCSNEHCQSQPARPPPPPPPPRSQAAISAVLTSHFGPTKERIIPFDLELLDLADNYDNTTGMFICTIPGTYVVSVYLMSRPGAKVNARVFINDRPVAALWADDSKNAGFYPSSSIQTIVQLGFGDQVYVMLVDGGYGDSWVHANYNVFTIFLLYEQVFK